MSEITDLIAIAEKQKNDITEIMSDVDAAATDIDTLATQVTTISTNLSLIKGRYVGGVPAAAVASVGSSTAAIESTTAVNILANTATTNIYVSSVEIYNSSSTAAVLTLIDATPATLWVGFVPAASGLNRVFDPPIKCAAAKNLQGKIADTNGVVTVSANGWIG